MPRRQQPARGRAPDPALREEIPISVLQAGEVELAIPPFFATPNKGKSEYKWKLVNPLTKIRNIAQRQGGLTIKPTRAVNVKKPIVGFSFVRPRPTMGDFSPEDREKLEEYARRYEQTKENEELVPAEKIENKQRGFPPVLFKNAIKAGLTKSHTSKTYYEPPPIPLVLGHPKKRGRPKKGKAREPEPEPEPEREPEPEPEPEPQPEPQVDNGAYISMEEFEAKSPLSKSTYLDKVLKEHPEMTIRAKTKREKTGGEFIFGKKPEGYKGKLNAIVSPHLPKNIYGELYQDFLRQLGGGGGEAPKIRETEVSSLQDIRKANSPKTPSSRSLGAEPQPVKQKAMPLPKEPKSPKVSPPPPSSSKVWRSPFSGLGETRVSVETPKMSKEEEHLAFLDSYKKDQEKRAMEYKNRLKEENERKKEVQRKYQEKVKEEERLFQEEEDKWKGKSKVDLKTWEGLEDKSWEFKLVFLERALNFINRGTFKNKVEMPYTYGEWKTPEIISKLKYVVEHYTPEELKLAKAKARQEAQNEDTDEENEEETKKKKTKGKGLSAYNKESDAYSSGDDEGESGGDLSGFAHKLIHGRKEFSPSAKRVLDANGTAVITGMELHRNPLPSLYQKTLSFLSGGETDQLLADKNKDKLFHLSLWVTLSSGRVVKIDKTTSVNLALSPKAPKQEESLEVKPVPPNLTLSEFLNRTLERVGVDRFFSYNAETNNCSDFIEMLLKEVGLWKEPSISFVEQPAKEILGRFGLLSKVVKGITDLGHRADIVMEGGDIDAQHQHFIHASGLNQKVDWEDLKWGSFTNQFHRFQHENPDSGIHDLADFARMILENPEDYRKTTKNRARFYLNVLLKQKSHPNNIMRGRGFHTDQHPALQSDLFPRIPQAYSQVYFSHPHPLAIHTEGGKISIHSIEHGAKKFFTHTLPSALIHKALPMAIGATASALTDNPAVGAIAGKTLGKEAGNALGKAVGMGVGKKKKFAKGSPEAREHMRKLREMRGKKISGGLIPSPPSRSPITDPSLL